MPSKFQGSFPWLIELLVFHDLAFEKEILDNGCQNGKTIDHSRPEAHRRRIERISRGNRDLFKPHFFDHELDKNLVVEHKVFRVCLKVYALQCMTAVCPVASVEL